jgi:hypothetical protein
MSTIIKNFIFKIIILKDDCIKEKYKLKKTYKIYIYLFYLKKCQITMNLMNNLKL